MKMYEGQGINEIYEEIIGDVISEGIRKNPRGKWTKEIRPVCIELTNPSTQKFLLIPGRGINYAFAMAEVLWILAGRSDYEFIGFYNKNMFKYLDNKEGQIDIKGMTTTHDFHGGYGKRIRRANYSEAPGIGNLPQSVFKKVDKGSADWMTAFMQGFEVDQLQEVYDKLQSDIHSRQAVVSLWDVRKDNLMLGRSDYPCNDMIMFSSIDGKLDMSVIRRSNDVVWGLPYNIIQFTSIQEYMAGWLGLKVGKYNEFINSLHIYEEEYPKEYEFFTTKKNFAIRNTPTHNDAAVSKAEMDRFMKYFFETELTWRKSIKPETHEVVLNLYIDRWQGELESISFSRYWKEVYNFLLAYHLYKAGHYNPIYTRFFPDFTDCGRIMAIETFQSISEDLVYQYSQLEFASRPVVPEAVIDKTHKRKKRS